MARVILVGNLAQLTGGVAEFQLPATSVQQLFRQLTEVPDAAGEAGPVQWNFEKWLVAADGAIAARFRPGVQPDAPEVRSAVEALLPG